MTSLSATALAVWLDDLGRATALAEKAEQDYRADFARRVAALAEERAVAYRRANLVRTLVEAIAGAEDEQAAVAHGLAVLRTRLGWSSDSEARTEILSRFAPVCAAAFSAASPSPGGGRSPAQPAGWGETRPSSSPAAFGADTARHPTPDLRSDPPPPGESGAASPDPAAALASFEAWYFSAKGTRFWILFENVMPETPLVDF